MVIVENLIKGDNMVLALIIENVYMRLIYVILWDSHDNKD
jgi:hypothetical protein